MVGALVVLLILSLVANALIIGFLYGHNRAVEAMSAAADANGTVIQQDEEGEEEEASDAPPAVIGFKQD